MKQFLFVFAFLSSVAVPLSAQNAVSAEIVVTASSVPETIEETPASVSVITKDDMDRRAARDVVDVLREVPGLAVARTGTAGKATSIFLRGGSSKQALVLWNGVEMNNPYFSGYDFGQMSSAGVERVEVVRGPFSALYGSEAVSGVVNVLTTPRASGARVEVEGGERGLLNVSASGALTSDRWNAHAAVERRADDGFAPNDDFDADSILGGLFGRPTENFSIGLLARYTSYDLGIPLTPSADSTRFVPSPERRQDGSESQIVAPIRFETPSNAFELRLGESRRVEHFADTAGPFGPERSDTTSRTRSARGTARFGTLTVGGEYEESVVDHTSNFSTLDERSRTNRSAFIEDRFSFSNGVEVTAGARYDDFEAFGSEVSPRLAVSWLRNGSKLRAAYGEGFRAPAIGELFSPFFGNDSLAAERSTTFEVGYDRFATHGSASVTLFRSDYDELIVFGDDFRFQNIAAADATGIEVNASRRFTNWNGSVSYTWVDSEDAATGETLIRRPEHSGSVAIGYELSRLSTHLVVIHAGARADVTDLIPFGRVLNDAYTTADLVLAWRLGAYQPFVKVENLTNERYQEVFGYESAARRVRVGVRYVLR
ncbi:MAG TPA: TonB-dependent receptor [Thermoanaerobaculia bacterium]|nr:TonB-dependent receptor [Thermoanaerobaculia bacterium]